MSAPVPPRAARRPHRIETHGDVRLDDYYWLRERDNPEVRAYLDAENAYVRDVMAHTAAFEGRLFEEIKARIKQTDMSVPYRDGAFRYFRRYEDGKEYPIYCREPIAAGQYEGAWQVILDVNQVAAGHEYCDVGSRRVSPDARLLAYAVDTVGRREYTIRVRDLDTTAELADVIPDVTSNVVWAADDRTLFYARHDPTTLRAYQIFRHRLGTDPKTDALVFEETDETFTCAVGVSRSKRFLMIESSHTLTTEYRYLDSSTPDGVFRTFLARERGHEYEVDHFRGRFYIKTNAAARNFRLMETDEHRPGREHWAELIPHHDDVLIEGFEMFRDHLVVEERRDGLAQIRVRPWSPTRDGEHEVAFDEPAYDAYVDTNRETDTATLRFAYSSMATPLSVYDYDMTTRARTLLKRDDVLGDFDPSRYETVRLAAIATDGARVPISLVRRRAAPRDGRAPLLLYGYGSYGISLEPTFRTSRLSLLDRGFTFAIAHVRGGEELGRAWYDDGKLLKKKNTFTDFRTCAEHLIAQGWTASDRIFAMGGSAGGLLMGAVINMCPDLFHGVVAQVPFVDVLTTMLDESIPLTTGEYDEWGNPNDPQCYDYIQSYSPYDNIDAVTWPHLLVMTGLHDSQVQYWEPAKWVAKRRAIIAQTGGVEVVHGVEGAHSAPPRKRRGALAQMGPAAPNPAAVASRDPKPGAAPAGRAVRALTDDRRLLLKTNMEAGHGGASGRYRQYRELALQYTFLLDLAGLAEGDKP